MVVAVGPPGLGVLSLSPSQWNVLFSTAFANTLVPTNVSFSLALGAVVPGDDNSTLYAPFTLIAAAAPGASPRYTRVGNTTGGWGWVGGDAPAFAAAVTSAITSPSFITGVWADPAVVAALAAAGLPRTPPVLSLPAGSLNVSTPAGPDPPPSDGMKLASVVGGVVGAALCLGAVVLGVLVYRRYRSRPLTSAPPAQGVEAGKPEEEEGGHRAAPPAPRALPQSPPRGAGGYNSAGYSRRGARPVIAREERTEDPQLEAPEGGVALPVMMVRSPRSRRPRSAASGEQPSLSSSLSQGSSSNSGWK